MARVLIVGGGSRGVELTHRLTLANYAVRVTTRTSERRHEIERVGGECWVGTPDRLETLRMALENVTVVCWLLASATGTPQQLVDLHTSRLRFFLSQTIDTTVRGFFYEAAGSVEAQLLEQGAQLALQHCRRNAVPLALCRADPSMPVAWTSEAMRLIEELLSGRSAR